MRPLSASDDLMLAHFDAPMRVRVLTGGPHEVRKQHGSAIANLEPGRRLAWRSGAQMSINRGS